MADQISWGVLGVADIAMNKVIPGMRRSELARLDAIASRSADKARDAASRLGIDKGYGSYQELLADPEIEAVYIPLPNHLHAEWAIEAAQAGKHVLCEKPIALSSDQARAMVAAAGSSGVKLMEAFMYRLHPMWVEVRRLVDSGSIGELRAIQSVFSYFNVDGGDIRNRLDAGGGALMDIGCYPVNVARMMFGAEPTSVKSSVRRDPEFGTDILTSALLDFDGRHAIFTCSTQLEDDQGVHLIGTEGRLVIPIPFNIPPDGPTRIHLIAGGDPPTDPGIETIEIPAADQYGVQADAFSRAILDDTAVPTDPSDAVANMEVMERIFGDALS